MEFEILGNKDTRSGFGEGLAELGRTNPDVVALCADLTGSLKMDAFQKENPDRFFQIIYWLGKIAIEEIVDNNKRTITFSPILRERLGHHIYGEIWANNIKETLSKNNLLERPIHIISANMHSVMNSIFAEPVLGKKYKEEKVKIQERVKNLFYKK